MTETFSSRVKLSIPEDEYSELRQTRARARKWFLENIPYFAQKVAPVYEALEWSWAFIGVPTIEDIEDALHDTVTKLLSKWYDNDDCYVSTGGLTVEFDRNTGMCEIKMEIKEVNYDL